MTQIIRDFRRFAPTFLKILTKDSRLAQFRFNDHQNRLYEAIRKQDDEHRPVRIIVLKARQMGISTFAAGYAYFKTATHRFTNSLTIAHDMASTKRIFEMTKRFYDFSPADGRPMRRYSNARELVFASPDGKERNAHPGLLSSMMIQTAGNKEAGRSATIHHAHLSEFAFWENAETSMTGLMQSIPVAKGTTVIIESTANGMAGLGQMFCEMAHDARAGRNDYALQFIPWFDNGEYSMDCDFDYSQIDNYERWLVKEHGVSMGQLAWRRYKIRTDFHGDVDKFQQEMPATFEEAFIASGRPVFKPSIIAEYREKLQGVTYQDEGLLRIYRPPEAGKSYAIGVDVAEGIASGDHSAAFVIDHNMRHCARFHGHIDPDLLANEVVRLARRYNNAMVAVEKQNHGLAVINRMKHLGYSNVYRRQVKDEFADTIKDQIGWSTDLRSKPLMMDEFAAAVREKALEINDAETLTEMATLVFDEKGMIDTGGRDLVIAAAIALQALKQTPRGLMYQATTPDESNIIQMPMTFQERMRKLATQDDESYFSE